MTGRTVDLTITWLAMEERPGPPPELPWGQRVSLLAAEDPPVDYFLYLYRTVGGPYLWIDWLERSREEQSAFVSDPEVTLHTMMLEGWPGGFFMLDTRKAGVCDLSYFGLVPEALGRGLGRWLLGQAIATGWDRPGVERMTVNTCTLDHPAALGLYQRMGFVAERRTHHRRTVPTELDPAGA
jgi:GNAT superfamily N-acetyltransferase